MQRGWPPRQTLADGRQQYVHSFRSAQQIARVGRFLVLQNRTLRSGDIGIYAPLFDETRSGELDDFRKNVLGAPHRNNRDGKLWERLEALRDNGFELGPTAKVLGLHVSTLRYRMQRLRTSAGLDWSTAGSRLELENCMGPPPCPSA